ncbi:MAG: NAD-binding protein [Calditrichaeota bacterium]|nr:NAD-binding protein [Calditrichota bacterium]MCB0268402.1 NAD-binding protein [Calditrichota bacterium]MCB9067934.1 NAD-binding protein [Calditrichia bacterium]
MKHLKWTFIAALAVILTGTLGYMLLEGWDPLDAFYMTIISITTTGFAEVRPLSPAGRVLTIFLIVAGVSSLAYLGGKAIQELLESQILGRRNVNKQVSKLRNHYIVCGYGRLGRPICAELIGTHSEFVVIEKNEDRIKQISDANMLYVHGDATNDDVLIQAGIKNARGLIAVLASDADNVYVTLSARELNNHIFIVTRAIGEEAEKKLIRAGANRIVKPYEIGALRMAHLLVRPGVVDFMDIVARKSGVDLALEEIMVRHGSELNGITLADSTLRQRLNIIIVAIYRTESEFIYNPKSSETIREGDRLIAIGEWENLQQLNKMCGERHT